MKLKNKYKVNYENYLKWTTICKYHLEIKKRNIDNNPWGALFEIKTRPLKET